MAAAKTYFNGVGDVNINKDVIAKSPDMHIQFYEFIGTGQLTSVTAGLNVLTFTGAAFTVDTFISTLAKNLVVRDDNNLAAQVKIDDNDATTVTFDQANLLLDSDGSTVASLTLNDNYDVYILTPSNDFTVGPFFGLTEGIELNLTDELMQFMYSIPQKKLFQDLKGRVGEIVGGTVNGITNEDVLSTLLGSDQFGSQTGQFSQGVGSDPDLDKFFRTTLLGEDRTSRQYQIIARKTQISVQGALLGSAESGHTLSSFKFDILAGSFYPDASDMLQIIRAD